VGSCTAATSLVVAAFLEVGLFLKIARLFDFVDASFDVVLKSASGRGCDANVLT
jgi:hypothetical protein